MNFFKKLTYKGPRCSRCNATLSPIGTSLDERLKSSDKWTTVLECANCGKMLCDHCTGFILSACECGSTQFNSYQMVRD
jgi:hypothetical protein